MAIDAARQERLKQVRQRIMDAAKAELKRGEISAMELLAIMAHTTGGCIAMQDQRKVTPELAMEIVAQNIQAGNAEAMSELATAGGKPV